jgi:hypothetical protein
VPRELRRHGLRAASEIAAAHHPHPLPVTRERAAHLAHPLERGPAAPP